MTTMYVTYEGTPDSRFDRDYWLTRHFSLVRESWGPVGLEDLSAFFPGQPGTKVVAIATCRFRDEPAMRAPLTSPASKAVMADVVKFTDIVPRQSMAVPVAT